MRGTELQPDIMVYYIDNKNGQAYVEIDGRTFELEIGEDITDRLLLMELEAIAVHDPTTVDEEPGTLRIDNLMGGVV